jgi:hypothetical protein
VAKTIIDELVVKLGFQLTGKDLPEKVKKDTDKVDSVEKKSATTTEQVEKRKTAATKKGARDRREQRERDTKERKKDIARETDEAKEYEDREKNKTSSMAAMIAKRFALAYAAKKTFDAVKNIGGDDAALVRLTESMNNKPEEVKAFANALQILTGDGQDAIQTLVSLQREIDNFNINHTNPEIAQNLGRLGIHMQGENGKSKSSVEIVSELRDVIKRSQFSKSEIYTLLQPLGISTDMYALLRSPDYEERIAQGRKNATNVTGSGQTFQKGIDFWGGTVNKIEDYIRQGIGGAGGLVDQAGNEAKKNGVDSAFFKGLIMQESGFNPSAKSSAGATGIGQMMGPAMDEVGGGGLAGSAKYFSKMLKKYGDYDTAAKAYNWGPGNMDSFLKNGVGIHGQPMPKETIDYVPSIMKNAEQFRRQEQSNSTSVQVDNININTQATDAKGIARDIRSAITMQSENGQR